LSLSAESEIPLGEAQHLFAPERRTKSADFSFVSNISRKWANFVRPLGARDVKGFALKTHEGLCPSTLQAFKKA